MEYCLLCDIGSGSGAVDGGNEDVSFSDVT